MTKVTSDEFWERLLDGLITACLSGWNSGLHFKLKGGDNKILFWFQNSYLSVLFLFKKIRIKIKISFSFIKREVNGY